MQELESLTYNFSVQSIGFYKSMEKEFPKINFIEAKNAAGQVSLKFIDAMNADGNDAFSNNLKASHAFAKKSQKLSQELKSPESEFLRKEHKKLLNLINEISQKLELVINKLIY